MANSWMAYPGSGGPAPQQQAQEAAVAAKLSRRQPMSDDEAVCGLFLAARAGDVGAIRQLARRPGFDPDARGTELFGVTALEIAAAHGRTAAAMEPVSLGACPASRSDALERAVGCGRADIVRMLLLELGAVPRPAAAVAAVERGDVATLRLLRDRRPAAVRPTELLGTAIRRRRAGMVEELLGMGAAGCAGSLTAACEAGDAALAERLLALGAEPTHAALRAAQDGGFEGIAARLAELGVRGRSGPRRRLRRAAPAADSDKDD